MRLFKGQGHCVLVWNKDDIKILRKQYRIVGRLIGGHPKAPRQNHIMSAPLYLSPDEVTLLIEKGFATLYEEVLEGYEEGKLLIERQNFMKEYLQKSLEEQRVFAREQKKVDVMSRSDEIIDGLIKKGKLNKNMSEEDKRKVIEEIISDIEPIQEQHMLVHQPAECPWPRSLKESSWAYPLTELEHQKYTVFKHLWQQEFYVTGGAKFGGDFLVYPVLFLLKLHRSPEDCSVYAGYCDPDLYHAKYIATCHDVRVPMTSTDVVQLARLASNVKKTALICCVDPERSTVIYTKLNYSPR